MMVLRSKVEREISPRRTRERGGFAEGFKRNFAPLAVLAGEINSGNDFCFARRVLWTKRERFNRKDL